MGGRRRKSSAVQPPLPSPGPRRQRRSVTEGTGTGTNRVGASGDDGIFVVEAPPADLSFPNSPAELVHKGSRESVGKRSSPAEEKMSVPREGQEEEEIEADDGLS